MSPIVTTMAAPAGRGRRVKAPSGGGGGGGTQTIAVSPTSGALTLTPTGENLVVFTLTRSGGFTGDVTPVASGLPTGVTAAFSPTTFGAGVTSMTMTVTAIAAPLVTNDAYTVTFSGSGVSDVVYNGTVTVQETWTYPNIGGGAIGPGANAPSWSGKTTYTEETFASPLPVGSSNAAGFRGYDGFGTAPFGANRIQYPTVTTPIGTKPVMRMFYRGQTETLTVAGQTSTAWPYRTDFNGFYKACVLVEGTWSGTLEFENSTDGGGTWNPVTLTARPISGSPHVTGTSTTINGLWKTDATQTSNALVRVRAATLSSGTVNVRVGQPGGVASCTFTAGTFTGSPTRFYQRMLIRIDPTWTDGGNTGTKGLFFKQDGTGAANERMNHYMYQRMDGFALQGNSLNAYPPTASVPADGEYLDCEQMFYTGTPGGNDGTAYMWINGQLVVSATNVPFIPSTKSAFWSGIWVDPTYGGGEKPPPYEQYVEYSNFYRESAP